MTTRAVTWGDLENAWDLGGLPTPSGSTRFGRIFRSMSPDQLDAAGWEDVGAAGVETVVDLRNDYEVTASVSRPDTIVVVRRPIEDQSDEEFMAEWGHRLDSPAYYAEVLRRWPELVAQAIVTIADAQGPVLFHCGAGRDRTGMISAIVGQLVGVDRDAILDDYAAGVRAFNVWLRSNAAREKPRTDDEVEAHLRTALPELEEFLDAHDFDRYLREAGVSVEQVAHIRSRLLGA